MKVLVACEFSGIVREAFKAKGHDAWSCDLLPTERPGNHYEMDIRKLFLLSAIFNDPPFDLMIAFPPCTHLAVSGARWFKDKQVEQKLALDFVRMLMDSPIPKICLENPVSVISTHIRKPDQIIQPYWFGDPYQKTTCIWLKGLVKLKPTNMISGREQKCWKESPGPNRWKNRSRTYQGVAEAMSSQWGVPEGWL